MNAAKMLSPGDHIGIFSPSEPITETRAPRLEHGIQVLESEGFHIVLAPHVFDREAYMAGRAATRAHDIAVLARDERVNGLMASWGGKSCNQMLPLIDYECLNEVRKPILAFSDGCVILNAITAQTHLITFYGPNIAGKLDETQHASLRLLREDWLGSQNNLLGHPELVNTRVIRSGRTQGRLFGGNLSTFVLGLPGSRSIELFEGGIFFWEIGSETPQIIDQYLTCLRNWGLLSRLRGMIVGSIAADEPIPFRVRDPLAVIEDAVAGLSLPVVFCPTFGHRPELENPIIPIGPWSELDTDSMSLRLLEPVVMPK